MTVQLTLRRNKGSALTNDQLDDNFVFLQDDINSVRTTFNNFVTPTYSSLTLPVILQNLAASLNPAVLSGKTISGSDNTISNISLNSAVTGILPIANGGTAAPDAGTARSNLGALTDPLSNGIVIRTGAGTVAARTLTVSGSGLTVTNGDGVAGNPTIAISSTFKSDFGILPIPASSVQQTGLITRTSSGTTIGRSILVAGTGLSVTNADGINGNPTISLTSSSLTDLGGTPLPVGTGFVVKTGNSATSGRSIQVTGSGLSITNGDGVNANPVIIINTASGNAPSTVVYRDANGDFSAGTITANLTGTASSATVADTATIAGAASYASTSTTQSAGDNTTKIATTAFVQGILPSTTGIVVKTAVGVTTSRSIVANGLGLSATNGNGVNGNPTITINSTSLNTGNTVVYRDVNGDFSARIITATLAGKADDASHADSAELAYKSLTKAANDNSTNIATTAYVQNAFPTSTGIIVKTSDSTVGRSVTVGGLGLSITDGNGVLANPLITLNSTSANTANTVVYRDASGNFSAGTITAALNGNATSANSASTSTTQATTDNSTKIATTAFVKSVLPVGDSANTPNVLVARDASGNFSAGIITAALNGNATSSNSSSYSATQAVGTNNTSIATTAFVQAAFPSGNGIVVKTGTGANIARTLEVSGAGLSVSNATGVAANPSVNINSTPANTANTVVYRDANGNFSAGTITATLSGAATSAVTAGYATSSSYSTTQATGTNDTTIATTAFVQNAVKIFYGIYGYPIEVFGIGGGGGGGRQDQYSAASGGAAGILASSLFIQSGTYTVYVGGGGQTGAYGSSASGGAGGVYVGTAITNGGAGGKSGPYNTSGGGGGGGAASAIFKGTTAIFAAGGGGGGYGAREFAVGMFGGTGGCKNILFSGSCVTGTVGESSTGDGGGAGGGGGNSGLGGTANHGGYGGNGSISGGNILESIGGADGQTWTSWVSPASSLPTPNASSAISSNFGISNTTIYGKGGQTDTAGTNGIVVIRYKSPSALATGGVITSLGDYILHTFTTSGTFTINF